MPNDMPETKPPIFAIERVVAFVLGPLLMAAAAYIVKLVTTWFPGVHLTAGQVEHILELAIAGVILFVLKWLHGRQIPALLHTPATIIAAVQSNPALLAAVAGAVGTTGARGLTGEPIGVAGPQGSPPSAGDPVGATPDDFVDDTPPSSDFAAPQQQA